MRAGTHTDFMRGTMANCFALLGDPRAGQRLLAELVGQFQAGTSEPRLEAKIGRAHV